MNISLSPKVQKFIEAKVRDGQYASPQEAVNVLLSHLHQQEQLTAADREELRAELDVGIAQADRGGFVKFTADDVIVERRAARAKKTKSLLMAFIER